MLHVQLRKLIASYLMPLSFLDELTMKTEIIYSQLALVPIIRTKWLYVIQRDSLKKWGIRPPKFA